MAHNRVACADVDDDAERAARLSKVAKAVDDSAEIGFDEHQLVDKSRRRVAIEAYLEKGSVAHAAQQAQLPWDVTEKILRKAGLIMQGQANVAPDASLDSAQQKPTEAKRIGVKISPEKEQAVIEAYKATGSIKASSKRAGVSPNAVRRVLRDAKLIGQSQETRVQWEALRDITIAAPALGSIPVKSIDDLKEYLKAEIVKHSEKMAEAQALLEEAQRIMTLLGEIEKIYTDDLDSTLLIGLAKQYEARRAKVLAA